MDGRVALASCLERSMFSTITIFVRNCIAPATERSMIFSRRCCNGVEWGNLKLANVTIATNESYKRNSNAARRQEAGKIFVVRNGPNKERMQIAQPSSDCATWGRRFSSTSAA